MRISRFDDACLLLADALGGDARRAIVEEAAGMPDFRRALLKLREAMQANTFKPGGRVIGLDRIIRELDRETRREGLHALNDWDGKSDKVNEDTVPVDVLNYLVDKRGDDEVDRASLAILVDYYFMYVLSLLSLRVWDDGDADDNLDELAPLLAALQGPQGSGQQFAADAETLILIATSHYELNERGYDLLLERVRTLNPPHRLNVALGHAAAMGCHLRFGFEATYARDTVAMRDDNVADYPWLCFSLATLMQEYTRLRARGEAGPERHTVAEAMLNGLSADARAFVGEGPSCLASCERERAGFRDRFQEFRADLLRELEAFKPREHGYSPLSFFFNFSHNVLKGTVIDALIWGEPWRLPINDLLTGLPAEGPEGRSAREAGEDADGLRARQSPSNPRTPDTGHRLRPAGRPSGVRRHDAQADRRGLTAVQPRRRGLLS